MSNTLWANVFVDELARAGLDAVCLAPGSRNTPLVMAFAQHPSIQKYSHLDERSAGFFALGLALASGKPVALVCSSGTAVANFYPAIIEAHQSQIPLLVLTADRPHELRQSGANQTIDQVKIFGDMALWSVDCALPDTTPLALRNLRTLAGRIYAKANGLQKGVVHVNMPFRKPLEPIPADMDKLPEAANPRPDGHPYTQFSTPRIFPSVEDARFIQESIMQAKRGIIICGPDQPAPHFLPELLKLADYAGLPVFADALSQVRFSNSAEVIGSYDSFLATNALPKPDLVIRFGKLPLSDKLSAYIVGSSHDSTLPTTYIQITESGVWADDGHTTSHFIQANPVLLLDMVQGFLTQHAPADTQWLEQVQTIERQTWEILSADKDTHFEGGLVADVVELLPEESTLFMGNSLPVRHLDQWGQPQNKKLWVYANRGASGIDGNISTALGCGLARRDKPLAAVVGDITFYHDMNGLLAVKRLGIPMTLVVFNNNGGGIFNRLPIKDHDPEFTEYFITPHDLTYRAAAEMYGLEYVMVDNRADFRRAFKASIEAQSACLIEVQTDFVADEQYRQKVMARLKEALNP